MKYIKILTTCVFIFFCTTLSYAKIVSVVSILPVKFFVEKIGGSMVDVSVLIPPGANPTTFEPRPKQIISIKRATVYFAIGVPFERKWIHRIKEMNPELKVIRLYKSVRRVPMASRYEGSWVNKKKVAEEFLDPHIWLSPSLVRIILMDIRDYFMEVDGKHRNLYLSNYFALLKEIDKLDRDIIELFSRVKKRYFMVFHPSWGYFAREFGLIQVPIEIEGKEPSVKEITDLVMFAKKKHIKVLFVQPEFSKNISRIVASNIGAKIEEIDPLSYTWTENLREVARKIADSLRNS